MKELTENKAFILTEKITDSMGEKVDIIQLNGFPKKAWGKTAKLRNALFSSFMQAQNEGKMPSSDDSADLSIDDSSDEAKGDGELSGQNLSMILMITDFDTETNVKRFFNLANDFGLLSVNDKPFTQVQWTDLDEMDLECIMYEYMAVFLFPSIMKMIQS